LEVQRDPERRRPVALDHAPVEVDPDDVARTDLVPGEQPRVAEQRAVAEVDRDVSGEVVVVALAPQRARQQHELLARCEVGQQLLGSRAERHAWRLCEWSTFPTGMGEVAFPRPDWVRRINDMAPGVGGAAALVALDPDELLALAVASTGLDDFGDP